MAVDSIAKARAKPPGDIPGAAIQNPLPSAVGVVDGDGVPGHPVSIYAEGKKNDVPLLVGLNADEGGLFAARIKLPADARPYAERIRAQFKDQADAALKLYPPGSTPQDEKASLKALLGDEIIAYGRWDWPEPPDVTRTYPTYS